MLLTFAFFFIAGIFLLFAYAFILSSSLVFLVISGSATLLFLTAFYSAIASSRDRPQTIKRVLFFFGIFTLIGFLIVSIMELADYFHRIMLSQHYYFEKDHFIELLFWSSQLATIFMLMGYLLKIFWRKFRKKEL